MTYAPPAPPGPPEGTAATAPSRVPWDRTAIGVAALTAVVVGLGVGLGFELYVAAAAAAIVGLGLCFASNRGLLYILAVVPFCESLGVGPVSIGRLMAVVAILVLLVRYFTERLPVTSLPSSTWTPAAAFTLVIVASGLWAANFDDWVFAIGQVGIAIAYFAAFALLVRRPEEVAGLLRVYVLGAVLSAGIGFYQAAIDTRAEGLQGDPNIYGLYQVAALPAAFALMRLTQGAQRWLWFAATVPVTLSILASQSRGSLLAFMATVLFMAALTERRRLYLPLAIGGGIVLGAAALLFDDRYAPSRVSTDRASGRIDIWYTAWHAFLDHPLTGIGAGNFVPQSIERLTTEPGVELVKSHLLVGKGIEVHNLYLEALTERGIFGLITLVALLACTLHALLAARRLRSASVDALAPMLVAFIVAAVFLSVPNSKLLWMLVGLAAALTAFAAGERPPTPSPGSASRSLP